MKVVWLVGCAGGGDGASLILRSRRVAVRDALSDLNVLSQRNKVLNSTKDIIEQNSGLC